MLDNRSSRSKPKPKTIAKTKTKIAKTLTLQQCISIFIMHRDSVAVISLRFLNETPCFFSNLNNLFDIRCRITVLVCAWLHRSFLAHGCGARYRIVCNHGDISRQIKKYKRWTFPTTGLVRHIQSVGPSYVGRFVTFWISIKCMIDTPNPCYFKTTNCLCTS